MKGLNFLEIIFKDDIPHCDECSGIIKPGRFSSNIFVVFIDFDTQISSFLVKVFPNDSVNVF